MPDEKNEFSIAEQILKASNKRLLVVMEKNAKTTTKVVIIFGIIVTPLVQLATGDLLKPALLSAALLIYIAATWVNVFLAEQRMSKGTFGLSPYDRAEILKHLLLDKEP